jgi:drug/metabolite transporter (DMT)-like permease
MVVLTALTALCGVAGAVVSKLAKSGRIHWAAVVAVSILPGALWAAVVKSSPRSLAAAGTTFDVVYAVAYFLTFVALGEGATPRQAAGAALAVVSLALLH